MGRAIKFLPVAMLLLSACHFNSHQMNSEGLALIMRENYKGAVVLYNKICSSDPEWMPAYYNRAIALANSGNLKDAAKDLSTVIKYHPDQCNAYFNRAIIHENMGDAGKAIKDYSQAIALQPDFLLAYHYRGMARFKINDTEGALKDFTQAIKLGDGVSMDIREAKEFGLNSSGLFFCRAAAYHKLGLFEKAIEDYSRSLRINPSNAKALYNRGAAYLKIGEKNKADKDFARASKAIH